MEINSKEKDNKKNYLKKIRNAIIITVVVLIIFSLVGTVGYIINRLDENERANPVNSNGEKLELKYTEVNTTIKEGIYITDVSEIVENVMPSIVAITSKTLISSGQFGFFYGGERYSKGAGSGVIVSESSKEIMILTNNHVVAGAQELSVQFIDGKSYDAKIIGTSERKDIAVISVSLNSLDDVTKKNIKIATLGNSNDLKVGNGIIAIGNALGYGQSVTTGVVSALNREVTIDNNTNKMIQIDAAINGGNSGGALLNNKGEVVGINSAKYSSSGSSTSASVEGMGFAIPISDVSNLITSLMNGEAESKGVIGIEGRIISDNDNIPTGFYIEKIEAGSGADKAGLEIGYIITKIEGNKVTTFSDIENVLYEHKKGDKITLTVKYPSGREYKEKEVKVTLS